uniref:Uncharacterized protein n=1 Tax=Glossina palpalis gambiensis TaxID=67801 RepID=A0A1B0AMV0_9MUSC
MGLIQNKMQILICHAINAGEFVEIARTPIRKLFSMQFCFVLIFYLMIQLKDFYSANLSIPKLGDLLVCSTALSFRSSLRKRFGKLFMLGQLKWSSLLI